MCRVLKNPISTVHVVNVVSPIVSSENSHIHIQTVIVSICGQRQEGRDNPSTVSLKRCATQNVSCNLNEESLHFLLRASSYSTAFRNWSEKITNGTSIKITAKDHLAPCPELRGTRRSSLRSAVSFTTHVAPNICSCINHICISLQVHVLHLGAGQYCLPEAPVPHFEVSGQTPTAKNLLHIFKFSPISCI